MRTADDLRGKGFVFVCYGSPWHDLALAHRGKARVPMVEYWGHPETGDFVRVYRGPALANAGRGHWKFSPLASWWRWHFGK